MNDKTNKTSQKLGRALGWAIICNGELREYGSGNDPKTLDHLGHDLQKLHDQGLFPVLVDIGDCLDTKMLEAERQDAIVGRYRFREVLGEVEL